MTKQDSFGGVVSRSVAAEHDPVADGRVDGSTPFAVLDAAPALGEHARDRRHEEADVALSVAPYYVVAAPSEADDVPPGGFELFRLHAPHDPEGEHAALEREHVRPNEQVDECVLESARRKVVLGILSGLQRRKTTSLAWLIESTRHVHQ